MNVQTLTAFCCYFVFLAGLGIFFYRRTKDIGDYLLGGRGLGSWVTALSAQASDMSGWLLMGLPGAIYLGGMKECWIAIGLFIGTVFNWILVSPRLRVYTQQTDTMTLSSFFEERFQDPSGLLRIISSIITLVFFTIYASSGLVASGKLFESVFSMDYTTAVVIGTFVIVLYTSLGGFLAVSWSDLFQGALMFVAITIVPLVALGKVGGVDEVQAAMQAKQITGSLFVDGGGGRITLLAIISTMAWGLGYFGQPHILARFMGIRDIKELPKSMTIAFVWVLISLAGAVAVGLISIPMFENLAAGDSEKVFIYMISQLFNPWIGGILLAAILSAIMSTIDSQLLVSSSTLTEDFYQKIVKKNATDHELMIAGRLCVVFISIIALSLAMNPENTVLGLVSYAWGGLGAAFGPLVLVALFSRRTSWQSALGGMIVGTVILIAWKNFGLSSYMYEIVPGFFGNLLTIFILNRFFTQGSEEVLDGFEQMVATVKGGSLSDDDDDVAAVA